VLAELGALVDAMKIRPVIGLELGLAEACRAHEIGEHGGVTGKIVLHVAAP
jgi:NADPH:quinone reductase-like Zn-dependent oxidoreductase